MKNRLNPLFAATAIVAGAIGLVACSDSDPVRSVASNTAVAVSPATASAAKAVVAALPSAGSTFTLPAAVTGTGGAGVIPAGSSMTLKSTTGTSVAAFEVKGANPADTMAGVMDAGSCIFRVTATTGTGLGFKVGDTFSVTPCSVSVATAGAQADGTSQSRTVTVTLGTVQTSIGSVAVTVTPSGEIQIGGSTVGNATFVTGT
ncbi:MAG: hypothetical protein JNK28_02875 [Burkholderiaceae bacterium]|nr:hypothetical protein [Burkholderiaceae bacterium]